MYVDEEHDVIPTVTHQPKTQDWCSQISSKRIGKRRKVCYYYVWKYNPYNPEIVKYDRANTFS